MGEQRWLISVSYQFQGMAAFHERLLIKASSITAAIEQASLALHGRQIPEGRPLEFFTIDAVESASDIRVIQ